MQSGLQFLAAMANKFLWMGSIMLPQVTAWIAALSVFSLFGSVLGRVMCNVSWCCPKQHLTLQDSLQCDSVTQSRFLVVTPSILSVVTVILRHVTLVTPVTLTHRNIAQCHKCYNLTPHKAKEGPKNGPAVVVLCSSKYHTTAFWRRIWHKLL